VRWDLLCGQGYGFYTGKLPNGKGAAVLSPHVHRDAAGKIRQREGFLPIAAIGRPDQLK
jgi:hypothetical protein